MLDLSPILKAVQQAAALCHEVQLRYLAQSEKAGKEPVTIADYGSQAIIGRAVQAAFPDDAILAEEQGDQFMAVVPDDQRQQICRLLAVTLGIAVHEADIVRWLDHGRGRTAARTWVIDPIDGTKGFLARRHYAIAVGIVEGGQPTGAVLGAPGYRDGEGAIFSAQGGQAWIQGLNGGAPRPIHVSDRSEAAVFRVVQSVEKAHASKDRMEAVRARAGLGAAPLREMDSMEKYGLVACGDADLYMRLPREGSAYQHKAWDHAAGTAIVLAAGGRVTDVDGTPLDFSQGAALPNRGMVVSNGRLHDRIIEAVQAVLAEEA